MGGGGSARLDRSVQLLVWVGMIQTNPEEKDQKRESSSNRVWRFWEQKEKETREAQG